MALLNLNFPCEEFIWKWKKAAPAIYRCLVAANQLWKWGERERKVEKYFMKCDDINK